MTNKKPGWCSLPIGTIINKPGSAREFRTGDWRSHIPIWEKDKCASCLLCFIYCPDNSIHVDKDGKVTGIDLDYCKGCGICAKECPKGAIYMEVERK
jgi:pyruvate ferredoxin oxidoreductase delta subunit